MSLLNDPIQILREQTIPVLRSTGGGGHADAIEAVIAEAVAARGAVTVSPSDARELQEILRTLSPFGNVLIRSARELVRGWEEQKTQLSHALRYGETQRAEVLKLDAEVARMERTILNWRSDNMAPISAEARRIRERRAAPTSEPDDLDAKCFRCKHARGEHDESECRGGEDILCRCDSFEESEEKP